MATNPRRHRLELPNPPNTDDPRVQAWMRDIRRLTMDEFNRLSGDFFDFKQEVIDSSTLPLASVAAITVTPSTYSAVFNWENPAQTQGEPTHVRVRIAEFGDTWAEYTYPINTWTAFGLNPSTSYTFQIQLVRRAASTISFVSALRNCPSLPVQVQSLSEIRSRTFETLGGLGPPIDDGGGGSVFPIPDPPGTPGPVGGTDCWWEWQLQIADLTTGEWIDTIHSGSVAGDAGEIVFDISTLDPLRLYRMKYREVCNGIPGPWQYGEPFTGGSDWLGNCGGNDPSASYLVTPYSTADLFAIPYLCMTAGQGVRVREFLSGIEIVPGFGYDLTFLDGAGEWNMLADIWDNSYTTKPFGSTVLPVLMGLDNSDDFSIELTVWMIDLPTAPPGGFGTGNIMSIGDGRIQFNVTYTTLGVWGIQFLVARESGGNFILNSSLTLPIGFLNDPVRILATVDQDGDKNLWVNDDLVAVNDTGEEARIDGMSGHFQLAAFSNMFVSKVYGWNRVLTLDDIVPVRDRIWDFWDRADNPASPGISTSGHTWVKEDPIQGTWGVIDESGYQPVNMGGSVFYTSLITIEANRTAVDISLDILTEQTGNAIGAGISFRVVDAGNMLLFTVTRSNAGAEAWYLQTDIDGNFVTLDTGPIASLTGTLRVVDDGNSIDMYKDGVLLSTVVSTQFDTATKQGIQVNYADTIGAQDGSVWRFGHYTVAW